MVVIPSVTPIDSSIWVPWKTENGEMFQTQQRHKSCEYDLYPTLETSATIQSSKICLLEILRLKFMNLRLQS